MSTAGGGTPDPDLTLLPIIPGSSAGDILYNAVYGNLSPNQVAAQTALEQAQLVQAGLSPSDAQSQATSDVNETLETYSGPGGLDLTWTGALPSQPGFPGAAGSAVVNTLAPTFAAIPSWVWWVLGGIGVFVTYKVVKDAF